MAYRQYRVYAVSDTISKVNHVLAGLKRKLETLFSSAPRMAFDPARCDNFIEHVIERVRDTDVEKNPFFHMYIERIFPDELYKALQARMNEYRVGPDLEERAQDNAAFVNRRFNLRNSEDAEIRYVRTIFEDSRVQTALAEKFYLRPSAMLDGLRIHEQEFEFVYTEPNRFQNIHIDIPPKFMSFVFYFPKKHVDEEVAGHNGTICYDKNLEPHYGTKYLPNSVGIFVPHFYSYHGFSSTIDRHALVMFYVRDAQTELWKIARKKDNEDFEGIKQCIEDKLLDHPLIEYGEDRDRILEERKACLINAPRGRVMSSRS